MKRCLNLGISLCLIGLLSGCCCGQRCGFFRGGCYAPSPCSPCGQPFGFAPLGGCNSCGTSGFAAPGGYPAPYGTMPSSYFSPYSTVMSTDGVPTETTALPPADGNAVTAYGQPMMGQPMIDQTGFNQPTLGQPAPFAQSPVTTALMKPDSLSTY